MSVRRDQVDAQKYVNRRLTNALLTGDPNTAESPLRSVGRSTLVGGVIALVVLLGFVAYGFVSRGGSTDWQQEGSVVVVRETGTRYVYLSGRLHPVANLTSAQLVAGGAEEVVHVAERSIEGAARGPALGILGAPDAVPDVEDLVHESWTVCTALVELADGRRVPSVRLAPGSPAPRVDLTGDQAVLVEVADEIQLLWAGARWPIEDVTSVLTAFNAPGVAPHPVGVAWANVVPAAPGRLALPEIDGRGEHVGSVGGQPTRIGEVLVVEAATGDQHYVVLADGLQPVTDAAAALVLADPRAVQLDGGGAATAREVGAATVNAAGLSAAPPIAPGLPDALPVVAQDDLGPTTGLCLTYQPGPGSAGVVSIVDALELDVPDGSVLGPADYAVADSVSLPPGRGALVQATGPSGQPTGTVYLVTDQGVKHALADEALAALGYDSTSPDPLPRTLLDAIPTGPSLDPDAALSVIAADGS